MAETCDRAALYAALDGFMDALLARDPGRVRWAEGARTTENNVALQIGDGIWGTATGRGDYDLRFADPVNRQVGLFTTLAETDQESAVTFRLAIDPTGAISEVETLIVRQSDEALRFENPKFERKPILEAIVPEGERMSRERLRAVADGYFNTLEQNDGQLFTRFHPECNRVENGVQTTNNPDFLLPIAGLPCEEQFRLGWYRYDDRLRARRFPLFDVERGLVMAYGFIDHCGRLAEYTLTNGEHVDSMIRRPHTFYLAELFRIEDGAIRQIEANFMTVPYHMPSPWGGR
ncbi:hypothetical protein FHS61_002639 [Altererythrobacter atlanticus]|uniref:hypothetical protein n=1 Tax=Croceibacterium atlanticum TaxID=1267766 RepID=UPI0017E39774|nr:hypothetical protein [Croceibacterium atlanticum]MBB5733596.1 hypothetical protein [Croceibacterium atlanticum]